MCMPKSPPRPTPTRAFGWTANSAFGYDRQRELEYAAYERNSRGATTVGGIEGLHRRWQQAEMSRGYDVSGKPLKFLENMQPKAAPAPAPAAAPAPVAPINPLAGLNIVIPEPPPPPKAFQRQTSPSSKTQRKAKVKGASSMNKSDLVIGRQY